MMPDAPVDGAESYAYNVAMSDVLGTFEQAVLLAVVRLDADAYGRAILGDVQARLAREVAAGAVHATLVRLERKRLVTSKLGAGSDVRGGRPKRFYVLTAAGRAALNDARETAAALWRGVRWPLGGRA